MRLAEFDAAREALDAQQDEPFVARYPLVATRSALARRSPVHF